MLGYQNLLFLVIGSKIFMLNFMSMVYVYNILKAKSNFTLLSYIPFLGNGEWYFKCV